MIIVSNIPMFYTAGGIAHSARHLSEFSAQTLFGLGTTLLPRHLNVARFLARIFVAVQDEFLPE